MEGIIIGGENRKQINLWGIVLLPNLSFFCLMPQALINTFLYPTKLSRALHLTDIISTKDSLLSVFSGTR